MTEFSVDRKNFSGYNNIVNSLNPLETCFQVSYFRTSRGGSGALYSQSAIVRVMLAFDVWLDGLPFESSDEVWSYAT